MFHYFFQTSIGMFLITTADQRFWKTDEPVLFLGQWCKLFSQRAVWEKLHHEVLPYHWDDRKKLYQDYLYLDRLYEQMLCKLSKRLNQIHRLDHSRRYWRIVIGPWLLYFIQIFYDRYQSILTAADCGKVTNTLIGRYKGGQWLPQGFAEVLSWSKDDAYNHYLYSRIIEHTNRLPYDTTDVETDVKASATHIDSNKNDSFLPKKFLRRLAELYERFIPGCFNQIVLVSSYLSRWDLVKLQLSLKQFPYLFPPEVVLPESEISWDLREKLSFNSTRSEFEQLLNTMLKEQIPSIYVEGYARMNQTSLDAYPRNPKVILTGDAYNSNDAFKFWAAHHANRGVKLAGIQYGGIYGTGLWSSTENHEIQIYDRFYTWGWESEADNTKPLAAAKFNAIKRNARPKKNGRLLLVLSTMPRYSYHMHSTYVASSGGLAYFNDLYSFIKTLSKKNQRMLLVRLYQHDWGWEQAERFSDKFPQIECYQGNKSMLAQLNESSLFIGTYNATTYLEAFAANFPTVLFWNPNHWELRPSAKPYFDELSRVGILHETGESAGQKVNEICDDPISWWQQSEIQTAKNQFCYQFAHTSNNWLKEWKEEFLRLKSGSTQ